MSRFIFGSDSPKTTICTCLYERVYDINDIIYRWQNGWESQRMKNARERMGESSSGERVYGLETEVIFQTS